MGVTKEEHFKEIDDVFKDDATHGWRIKNDTVLKLSRQYPSLIVDNSQAFFSKPLPGVDTFYSCRKFFGVPDGGYVSLSDPFFVSMHVDTSFDRCAHLLKNIDCGAEAGYHDYQKNEEVLKNQAIKEMSVLTRTVMSSVNYEDCSKRRSANFLHLNKHLAEFVNQTVESKKGV